MSKKKRRPRPWLNPLPMFGLRNPFYRVLGYSFSEMVGFSEHAETTSIDTHGRRHRFNTEWVSGRQREALS